MWSANRVVRIYLIYFNSYILGKMRLFLAGENGKYRIIKEVADMNLRPYILESFYEVRNDKKAVDMLPYYGDYLLDSGAYTFMNSGGHEDWEAYIERYADFVVKNNIQKFFELDIDSIVGYDKVKEFRYRLERLTNRACIPVWHKSRGLEDFFRVSEEYSYIGIGDIAIGHIKVDDYKYFPYLIREAHRRGCKVHGLGITGMTAIRRYHFDTVDSTAWTTGNRFGGVYIFDGRTMKKIMPVKGQRMANPRELAIHNFLEWVKFQKYAEVHF